MRKFWSLVKKEWHMYKAWPIIHLIVGVVFIGLLPMFEHRFTNSMTGEELRLLFMGLSLLFIGFATPLQFLLSIKKDIKVKVLWLHNSGAITMLIGAKLVYTLIWIVMLSILYTFTFHFVEGIVRGTVVEIICLQLFVVSIVFILGILTPLIALPFYTVYLQLKRYISYGSVIITGAAFVAFLFAVEKCSSSILYGKLLRHGEISLQPLEVMLPTFSSGGMHLTLGSLYIVEELVIWALLAACFIAASKWIERVVTR